MILKYNAYNIMDSLMDFQMLFDTLKGEEELLISDGVLVTEEDLMAHIHALVEEGLLIQREYNDEVVYDACDGLSLMDFIHVTGVQRDILMMFVKNPKGFFMLGNTQNGKSKKIRAMVREWTRLDHKMVGFVVVDNDTSLSDQFVDGLRGEPVEIFRLSGTGGDKVDKIIDAIDAYVGNFTGRKKMPLIVLLSNEIQNAKMVEIIQEIDLGVTRHQSPLRYGVIWDECDVTYVRLCDQVVKEVTVRTFLTERTEALHQVVWVTATEGTLLDDNLEYPECLNAQIIPFIPDPETQPFYAAAHLPDAVIHRVEFIKDLNQYAFTVLEQNLTHFTTPIQGQYRKILVNSTGRMAKMNELARECVKKGMNAIVFNGEIKQPCLILHTVQGREVYPLKGYTLNQLLFYLYKKRRLESMPLVVLGNRKVNRGLSFHYCPRVPNRYTIQGKLGDLVSGEREGLVFTDMILGQIKNPSTAVQKAGRLAGLIRDSPQYTGSTHYWTDTKTASLILDHNKMVDAVNQSNNHSMREVMVAARHQTHRNHDVDDALYLVYNDEAKALKVCEQLGRNWHTYRNIPGKPLVIVKGFITSSVGGTRKDADGNRRPSSLIEAIQLCPKDSAADRSYLPCYKDLRDKDTLHYVFPIRKTDNPKHVAMLRDKYPPIRVPQTGDF